VGNYNCIPDFGDGLYLQSLQFGRTRCGRISAGRRACVSNALLRDRACLIFANPGQTPPPLGTRRSRAYQPSLVLRKICSELDFPWSCIESVREGLEVDV